MAKCKYCDCTEEKACVGGCEWVTDRVCSNCIIRLENIEKEIRAYLGDPNVKMIEICMTDTSEEQKHFLIWK